MPDIGYYHPQIVHFIIAGLLIGIGFRWLSLTGKFPWADRPATIILVVGAIVSVFAVLSGTQAHELAERIPGVAKAVQDHEDAGHDVRNFFLIIAAVELLALIPAFAKWRKWLLILSGVLCVWGAYDIYDVGRLGGVLVYSYAGGVGMRTGDSADVNNTVRAALYNRALLDRQQKNADAASKDFAELAQRFPNDPQVQLAAIGSMITDKKDPAGALAALRAMPAPPDTSRMWGRYQSARADAFEALGQKDSARAVVQAMLAKFPQSERLKARLQKLQ
jgi:uncharacterized membrane protein